MLESVKGMKLEQSSFYLLQGPASVKHFLLPSGGTGYEHIIFTTTPFDSLCSLLWWSCQTDTPHGFESTMNQTWKQVVLSCNFGCESRLLLSNPYFSPNPCLYLAFPFQIDDITLSRKKAKKRFWLSGLPALLTHGLWASILSKNFYINLILWPGVDFSEITPYLIWDDEERKLMKYPIPSPFLWCLHKQQMKMSPEI